MSNVSVPSLTIKLKVKAAVRPFLLRMRLSKQMAIISTLRKVSVGKEWPLPEIEQITGEHKVLVISPHPDDDVLGCGGTIKKFCRGGSRVKTVIVSDGCMGKGTAEECNLVAIRANEAKIASDILGCNDLIFLDNIDKKIKANGKNKDRMLELLNEFNPDKIFVPSIFESHSDHLESTLILAHALKEYGGQPVCYCYEVWAPLFPNTLVDITDVLEDKKKAIDAHWSQITHSNLGDCIMGLNSYRAIGLGKEVESCEAFYKCPKDEFVRMALTAF